MNLSHAHPANRNVSQPFFVLLALLWLAACSSSPSQPEPVKPAAEVKPVAEAKPAAPKPATGGARPGGYYKDDGPDDNPPPNLDQVPDAVPSLEPLHRFANRPYEALGQSFTPRQTLAPYEGEGIGSWYGKKFNGKRTSSGEIYNMYAMTGAHPTLPIPSYARVTNLSNGRSVIVRINDRGPFHAGREIDLSYTAAYKLDYIRAGQAKVRVEAIIPEGLAMLPANPAKSTPAPVVVQAPAAPTPLPDISAPPMAPGIYLQLGAFAERRNAESFRDYANSELGKLNENIYLLSEPQRYRLQLGPFASEEAARKMADTIATRLKFKPFMVRL